MIQVMRSLKNKILPTGMALRTLPLGLMAGARLKLDFHRHTQLWLGIYERELTPFYRELVQRKMRCFDVGGDIGYSAILLAKLSQSQVISFECNPESVANMRESFAANPGLDIDIIQSYVGATNDDSHITIDEAARRTFIPDFIKMDIEGAEADALLGSQQVLRDRKPHLIIETHGLEVEVACLDLLRQYDYAPQIVDQRHGIVHEDRPLTHNRWLGVVGGAYDTN